MQYHGVNIPEAAVADFCRRHRVRSMSLFGSILTPDFSAASDIDFLVEFEPGQVPSLFGFAGMQLELKEVFGREVHLHTPSMLPPSALDRIRREARLQYAA